MSQTSLRPFFSYYGGKWRDAPRHYPAPSHDMIVEPFAGSAGYSLRYYDRRVVLYDLDPVLCGLWDYLINVSASEILSIPDVPLDGSVDDLDVPQEARWLVGFWINKGSARPCKRPSKWMRGASRPHSFWGDRVRARIASQVDAIRHWKIRQGSYQGIEDFSTATWFVDPPYQSAGKHYKHGCQGIDYPHLGEWCQSLRGQVIVCENDGATWLPFAPLADVKTARRGRRSREAIWTRDQDAQRPDEVAGTLAGPAAHGG